MVEEGLKKIVIGDIGSEDLPSVIGIEQSSFTTPWSEISFFNELKNPGSIVKAARKDGKIIGYIFVSLILDEGHILDLAVHPEFRRLGVAAALVRHVIGLLREKDCKFVFLEVRASNVQAARLYEKFGFQRAGIRKQYYTSPEEDGVFMSLKLED